MEAHAGSAQHVLQAALKHAEDTTNRMKLQMGIDPDAPLVDQKGQPVSPGYVEECKQALLEQMRLFDEAVAKKDAQTLKALEADWQAGIDEHLSKN
jgi:hypothetical protein